MEDDNYEHIDPDTLYYKVGAGTMTFIYTRSGELFEDKWNETHTDMLNNEDTAIEVYGGKPFPKLFWNRSTALPYAILGRYGIYQGEFIIAIWNEASHSLFKKSLEKLLEVHPQFKELADKVVLLAKNAEPAHLSDYLSGEKSKKKVEPIVASRERSDREIYRINRKIYSKHDIVELIKSRHSQSWRREEIDNILCSPDMHKYPDLISYIPAGCHKKDSINSAPKWGDWVRASGLAYEGTLGFKNWLKNEKITT